MRKAFGDMWCKFSSLKIYCWASKKKIWEDVYRNVFFSQRVRTKPGQMNSFKGSILILNYNKRNCLEFCKCLKKNSCVEIIFKQMH